jgi:GNAT superfamily N-acetyltransferase
LAENENDLIGTGIMFFYDSVPSVSNLVGKNAYITSMFVNEQYRRQKIGSNVLTKLIELSKEKSCNAVMLNATEIGKKLYLKHGFINIENDMIYKIV